MFKLLLSLLLVLSMGWAEGKKERSIVKKKVVKIISDDEHDSKDVQVEADVDDETLHLTITVNGEEKEFEVPLNNSEAMAALKAELEELDVDIHIAGILGSDEDDHDFRSMMRWHGNENGGGYLGVQIQGLDGQLADYFGAKNGGVLVTEVIEDSPAEKGGLKAGDVIVSVAGEDVEDSGELVEEIRGHKPDSKVELKVLRKNRSRKIKVTLGEAPHSMDMGFGQGKNRMFYSDSHGFDDEVVDVFFNMDHGNPHKMMKKFRYHDEEDEDDIDELEDDMDELREEMKKLRADMKKLKDDS